MSNANGAKGTKFEASLLPLINEFYPDSVRLGKQGTKDCGDFHMPGNRLFIVEAKNVKRMDLAGWLEEAAAESMNKGVPHGVVVHKRRGVADPAYQYCTLHFGSFLELVCRG